MATRQGLQRLLRSCPSLTGPSADASGWAAAALGCTPVHSAASSQLGRRPFSAGPDAEEVRDISNPRVLELAEQIVQLNLLEVSDLTEVLKKRLNIQPAAFGMPMGMPLAAQPSPSGAAGDLSSLRGLPASRGICLPLARRLSRVSYRQRAVAV